MEKLHIHSFNSINNSIYHIGCFFLGKFLY